MEENKGSFEIKRHEQLRELPLEFTGIGEVRGFYFKRIAYNGYAYIYSVAISEDAEPRHYEIFERKVDKKFNLVKYPRSNSFGLWAKTTSNREAAEHYYKTFTKKVKERERLP